jgi:hypothetical protein
MWTNNNGKIARKTIGKKQDSMYNEAKYKVKILG